MGLETVWLRVLWATSENYPSPQFIAAFCGSEVECWREQYERRRAEAEEWWRHWGDTPPESWRFFTTDEKIERPAAPSQEPEHE